MERTSIGITVFPVEVLTELEYHTKVLGLHGRDRLHANTHFHAY
jgi:hypothetical protein